MGIKFDYGSDIRLCLDVGRQGLSARPLECDLMVLSPFQHFRPSEQDGQTRDDLLDHLTEILNERFGSGFDVEYVGIGRYATDIQQAPLEVAIIVCIGPQVLSRC